MKNSMQIVSLSVFMAVMGFLPVTGIAQTYLGEVCWLISETGESEIDFIKLAASNVGDNHITLNGYTFSLDDESIDERSLLSGNAEVFEDQVFFNIHGNYSDEDEHGSISAIAKLSLSTLNGTAEIQATVYDKTSEQILSGSESAVLTLAACPE